ncbi:MAG: hypothetical protein Q7R52_03540 [archaeon]|nr:hypothetical protein [archaeon]
MQKNNEIRFRVTSEEKLALNRLWKELDKNLKWSGFCYRVFVLGINEIMKQARQQGKESLMLKALTKK